MKTKIPLLVLSTLLLAFLLAGCGSQTKLVAPEIDPPSDLIPGHVPEGFEMKAGFKIDGESVNHRFSVIFDDNRIDGDFNIPDIFSKIKNPAGNDLLGVYYQDGDNLLLITKSYYPGGSFESWLEMIETDHEEGCECDCEFHLEIGVPVPLRGAQLQEVRTIGDTSVAVLDGPLGLTTVFVKDEYLVAVEGDIPLEEHLAIITSLLEK